MIYDTEIEELEAEIEFPTKKSRQTPTVSLDEIAREVERELGYAVLSTGRQQPDMNTKKVFCWVAMELGHHPSDVGARCGIRRSSTIHHHKSMEEIFKLCGVAKKVRG